MEHALSSSVLVAPASPSPPTPETPVVRRGHWSLAELAGRICELVDDGQTPRLSFTASLLREAQEQGQPTAWIHTGDGIFHAPDLAEGGIDLAALPLIRTPHGIAAARAADHLLRSGAFGLVIVDLGMHCDLPPGMQSRLAGLTRHHRSTLLCLTKPSTNGRPGGRLATGSLGSLVSLRAQGNMRIDRPGYFRCTLTATRDKRHGLGWTKEEVRRGPSGLC
jgi:recombination protein RecA